MNGSPDTIRIVIPLTLRRRNGRPRILPPPGGDTDEPERPDPRTLRAIGRAWSWRRRLERGEAATIQDIAAVEKISDRYVSRLLRIAYLSPAVLEQLIVHRRPCALSINDLTAIAYRPWAEQPRLVIEG